MDAPLRMALTDGRPAEEMRHERDELVDRLGIVAMAEVPLLAKV